MDWTQFSIFIIGISGLFYWNRSESRNDIRNMDQKLDAMRMETMQIINAIHQEIKDFHGRLCALEEKNKNK